MAAPRASYRCRGCEYRTGKWLGRCPECEAWDSFEALRETTSRGDPARPTVVRYPDIADADTGRTSSGISELDRVLGGGLVAGAVVLIGGEPGIGKSTLLLQAASAVASGGRPVLYVSGEESAAQLRTRGERLGVASPLLSIAAETGLDAVIAAAEHSRPALIVVDSIQAIRCPDVASVPGSVSQVREAASRLVEYAKAHAVPTLLVGHVTKDGSLAGPRALEHVVDTVVQFEGDRHHEHRILRTLKNRFGPTDELGVFRMTERGLEAVDNPSALFLAERAQGAPGSVVLAAVEGSRPLLVEVQALVGDPVAGSPRRTVLGIDSNRVAMVLAVLQRAVGLELASRDVFVNVTGGLQVSEPGADLALALALASSFTGRALPAETVAFGEIGLTGEIRAVARAAARLREAARGGFAVALGPARGAARIRLDGMRSIEVERLEQAYARAFESPRPGTRRPSTAHRPPPAQIG